VLARGEVLAEGDYASVSQNPASWKRTWDRSCLRPPRRGAAPARRAPLLAVRGLNAWYGESHILHGVTFDVRRRGGHAARTQRRRQDDHAEVDHGRRAAPRRLGRFDGTETIGSRPTASRARHRLVPERERGIFASLNVEENLMLPPKVRDGGLDIAKIYELLFPTCASAAAARAPSCPSGEQQMLAIGRHPAHRGAVCAVLDEPTEGLAPVDRAADSGGPSRALKTQGIHDLLVEQNFASASTVADRHYIMETAAGSISSPMPSSSRAWRSCHDYLASGQARLLARRC
jgi:branched-chain amino acid transport system ATP-binding protein